MTRKITALITATLLTLALLPGVALANTVSSAALVQGLDVFPGTARDFAIQVTNNEDGPVLGLIGSGSTKRIRSVEIILPTNSGIRAASGGYTAPDGWSVIVGSSGFLQTVTFVADGSDSDSNGIARTGSVSFPFPADVLRPLDGDRSAEFQVWVSDTRAGDQQRRADSAGAGLTSTVRVLEVLQDTMGAIVPPGASDGSGTAGQTIEYAFDVFNHAQQALTVQPNLSSSRGSDQIAQGGPVQVPANDSATLSSDVTLGAANSDTTSTFTASGQATDATPGAAALAETALYAVQVAPRIQVSNPQWDAFVPRFVRSDEPITYTFELPVTKINTPALTLTDGYIDFCNNRVDLVTPVSFAGGQRDGVLQFGPTTIDFDGDYAECNAVFRLDGIDGNDFEVGQDLARSTLITIDNLVPQIDLEVTLPTGQYMAKSGDNIRVDGSVDRGCDTLDFIRIQLEDNTVVVERDGDEVSCNGTSFNTTFQSVDFDGFHNQNFDVYAQATGHSGITGDRDLEGDLIRIDNFAPIFDAATIIRVPSGTHAGKFGIHARFDEDNTVYYGCSTSQWNISGGTLLNNGFEAVLYSDGTPCVNGQPGPDNSRILVPNRQNFSEAGNNEADIEYEANTPGLLGPDTRVRDGARWFAPSDIRKAVWDILPPLPDVLEVRRINGSEEAYFDEDEELYYTREGGNDLDAKIGDALSDYLIEVLEGSIDDGGNCVVGSRVNLESAGGENWVDVPIGTAEGEYVRAIRFVNGAGIGPAICIGVVLDQTAPEILGAVAISPTRVDVEFDEKVLGPQNARSWYAWLHADHRDDQAFSGRDYYGVESVSGSGLTRELEVNLPSITNFGGVDYRVPDGFEDRRVYDRAGNRLADTAPW